MPARCARQSGGSLPSLLAPNNRQGGHQASQLHEASGKAARVADPAQVRTEVQIVLFAAKLVVSDAFFRW